MGQGMIAGERVKGIRGGAGGQGTTRRGKGLVVV
jgi:hypothetical protein